DGHVTGVQTCALPISVTVGGVTMNSVTQAGESTNGTSCLYVYYLFAPSGVLNSASATITITCFNPAGGAVISVGTLTGSTTVSEIGRASCRESVWESG